MSYLLRSGFLCWIIIFTIQINVSEAQSTFQTDEAPALTRIILNNDSIIVVPPILAKREIFLSRDFIISYRNNNILFEVGPSDTIDYQYFLEGFDTDWTEWRKVNFKEYTNLPVGKYVLRTRYINSGNSAGEFAALHFRILPLWCFSPPSIIIYLILLVILIWAIYNQLNLRYARRQYILEQLINTRTEDLIIEKEKTEALLANILPKNTASELMEKGKATKMKYNFVTVLFSDIQGFTKIAEEMNPEVLIDELDKFFFHFDSVVEQYGIEKIKTIGDAYMCAGGIPEKNRTNPVEVILAALEMKAYMKNLKEII